MTEYRFTDDEYNDAIREAEEAGERLKKSEEAESRLPLGEALRIFEPLSRRIENEPAFPFPPSSPTGDGNNNNNNGDDANNGNSGRRNRNEVLDSYYRILMQRFTFKTLADSQEILWYDPTIGVYRFNGEVKIKTELGRLFTEELEQGLITIANLLTEHDRKEIVSRIKWNTITERELFDSGFDNVINVANGLLDIRTKQLKEHSPKFLSTKQFPIKYVPSATWTPVLRFLKQIQNREGVNTLLKMFGYILMTNTNKYQKAFFFAGLGNNGKSVLVDLINAFVGKENFSSVKLHDLRKDRFMAAQMYGKVVNTYADIPGTNIEDVGLFKALVSGDEITGQHKYGSLFSFRNRAKLIYSGNKIPLSEGEDDLAYFKRWVMLKFDALFTSETEDRDLLKKLTAPENLSGLLNLALAGVFLLERDGFENVPIEVIREEYNRESESLKSFVDNKCTINVIRPEYFMEKEDFYDSYLQYCEERKLLADGEKPLSAGKVEIELSRYKVFEKRMRVDGLRKRCYKGIITTDEAARRSQEILERQQQGTL